MFCIQVATRIRAYEIDMFFRVAPPLENPFARSLEVDKVDTNSGVAHLKNQVDKVDPNSETVAVSKSNKYDYVTY